MHFTVSGVVWECPTTMASDLYPNSIPKGMNSSLNYAAEWDSNFKRLLFCFSMTGANSVLPSWTPELYEVWNHFCNHYSCKELTFVSDKLVALTGVANEVSRLTGDVLICGMSNQHLIPQLL